MNTMLNLFAPETIQTTLKGNQDPVPSFIDKLSSGENLKIKILNKQGSSYTKIEKDVLISRIDMTLDALYNDSEVAGGKRSLISAQKKLQEQNFKVSCIHGNMNITEREEAMRNFRSMGSRVLISTDLLGRGIDVQQVSVVINYDIPLKIESYIHRIGRCGRFNKKGVSISFIKMNDNNEMKLLNMMKNTYKINIKEMPENIDEFKYEYYE